MSEITDNIKEAVKSAYNVAMTDLFLTVCRIHDTSDLYDAMKEEQKKFNKRVDYEHKTRK